MNKKISFAGPSITSKEINYVTDAVKNGWYDNYDYHIQKLEKTFSEYLGVKYAIATHCCTHALHLATASIGLQKNDEVIVTDFSWIATAYAILYTGAKCVFADIDPDTWTIDPNSIRRLITHNTKAIMLVHTFGHPADMDEILSIAKENNLYVIEDAAPAIGAQYKGNLVGTFGDVACFSFQGAKMTVSGEGGILVTNNKDIYNKAKLLASMGRTDSQTTFWSDMLGYQYTMGNITASLALAQIERVEELLTIKRRIFSWYASNLNNLMGVKLISEKLGCKSSYCYPSILLQDSIQANRDDIVSALKELNIHSRPAFPRMSSFPLFKEHFNTPVTKQVENQGICLPSAANITKEDVYYVCENLKHLLYNKV